MPKTTHRLTAVTVQNVSSPGFHADGAGLYLKVDPGGSKSWVYRYTRSKKTRYLGLGSVRGVGLAAARSAAAKARHDLEQGKIPSKRGRQRTSTRSSPVSRAMKFKECAEALMNSHEASWKNPKHRQQWRQYPEDLCLSQGRASLRSLAVTTEHVLSVLEPIWTKTPETASRVRGRIEAVLDAAKARGARDGGRSSTLARPSREPAAQAVKGLPRRRRARAALRRTAGVSGRAARPVGVAPSALEFTILTAARTNEALGAQWS